MDKRGQGLSTSTIILLVLGVIILVVLILGFTVGWGKLKAILGGGSGSNNIDQVSQSCQMACSTKSLYDFCSSNRTITQDGKPDLTKTCKIFASDTAYINAYHISDCTDITCPSA